MPKTEDTSLQGLKNSLAENLRCRESLNSSGTVSRKTSTASDYTPENTYVVQENKSLNDATNVSYSTESCVTAVECQSKLSTNVQEKEPTISLAKSDKKELEFSLDIPKNDTEYKVGQKVDIKVVLLRQDSAILSNENVPKTETKDKLDGTLEMIEEKHVNSVKEQEETKEKSESEAKLKVPQRKISRFLVSPVLSGQLDLPKNKDFGDPPVENAPSDVKQPEIEPQVDLQPQRKDSVTLELKGSREVERGQEVTMEVAPKATADSNEAPVCGPEMITLEQLKISLEHLKQGGPVSLKDSQKSVTTVSSKTSTTVPSVQASQVPTPQTQQTLQPTQQQQSQTVNIPQSTSAQQINVHIAHQVSNIQQQIPQNTPAPQQPQSLQQQQQQSLQQQPQSLQQPPQPLQQQPPQTLQQQPPQTLQQQPQSLQQQQPQPQPLQQQHQTQTLQQQTLQPPQIQAQIPQSLSQPQMQQINQTLPNITASQGQPQPQASNTVPVYPQQTQIMSQISACTTSQLTQPAQPVPIYQQPIAAIPPVLSQAGYVQQQPSNNTTVLPPLQINPISTYTQVAASVPLQATTPPQNAPIQGNLLTQTITSPPTNIPQPNLDVTTILPTGNVQQYPSTVPQQVPITPNYNNFSNNVDNQAQATLTTTAGVTSVNVEQSTTIDEYTDKTKKIAPNLKLVIEK